MKTKAKALARVRSAGTFTLARLWPHQPNRSILQGQGICRRLTRFTLSRLLRICWRLRSTCTKLLRNSVEEKRGEGHMLRDFIAGISQANRNPNGRKERLLEQLWSAQFELTPKVSSSQS